jgi:SAM-dependent methyltransferase
MSYGTRITITELGDLFADPAIDAAELRGRLAQSSVRPAGNDLVHAGIRTVVDRHGQTRTLSAAWEDDGIVSQPGTRLIVVLAGLVRLRVYSLEGGGNPVLLRDELAGMGDVLEVARTEPHCVSKADSNVVARALDVSFCDSQSTRRNRAQGPAEQRAAPGTCYWGYEDRYRQVYEAGAALWETPDPNEAVVSLVESGAIQDGSKIIDLGCGEGRDTIYLSRCGYSVLGVDVSPTGLDRARQRAQVNGLPCRFLERDVLYLRGIPDNEFDWALNMGCLHMIPDDDLRARHLRRVREVLRPGGLFLLAHCRDSWLHGFFSVPDPAAVGAAIPGRVIPRRIRLPGRTAMLPLELLPYCERESDGLCAELAAAGFEIATDWCSDTAAFGNTAVIMAAKTL